MTSRWGSQNVVCEYKDLQASCMTVNSGGQLALLAGRRALALVDLTQTSPEIVKRIPRQSKWDVNAVEWNPHHFHSSYFVLASSQRADIFTWDNAGYSQKAALKSHTRVISDIDWSPFDANIVATCSVDTYTYLWDVRDTRKPTTALQAVAGVSQVKWNKVSSNVLATTHDGDIRIWDPRKSTAPFQYIAGHLSKIYGLDWSPNNEHHLATSSQDCTVKFWNVNKPKHSEMKLQSKAPVWRARYTPFGRGLVTVVVPQLRRGEHSLCIWCLDDLKHEVDMLLGHKDMVLEFQWRYLHPDNANYELVTWGRDHTLRIWQVDPNLQKQCGHDVPVELLKASTAVIENNELTVPDTDTAASGNSSTGSQEQTNGMHEVDGGVNGTVTPSEMDKTPPNRGRRPQDLHSPQQPKSLRHEFELVNVDLPNIKVYEMDPVKRMCAVSGFCQNQYVNLTMMFPPAYPHNTAPTFRFGDETTISQAAQEKLAKELRDHSLQHVKYSKSCLEPCLWKLVTCLEALSKQELVSSDTDLPYNYGSMNSYYPNPSYYNFPSYMDNTVPFPRTSGARFCGAGFLVCFTRKSEGPTRRISSTNDVTPRALTALGGGMIQGSRTPQGSNTYNIFGMAGSPQNDSFAFYEEFGTSFADVIPLGGISSMSGNRGSHGSMYNIYARSPPVDSGGTILGNYYNSLERRNRRGRSKRKEDMPKSKEIPRSSSPKKKAKTGPVIVYDIYSLMPPDMKLADSYVINRDIPSMCSHNAAVAEEYGRRDLLQTWALAGLVSSQVLVASNSPDVSSPWSKHVFGRKMIMSLFDYYSRIYDVQTLAMLCCAFGLRQSGSMPDKPLISVSRSSSQTDTPNPSLTHHLSPSDIDIYPVWSHLQAVLKLKRSNSLSELDYRGFGEQARDPAEIEQEEHSCNIRLLDPSKTTQYDSYLTAYGDLLYAWGLHDKRAEVLQYVSKPAEAHSGIEFTTRCQTCNIETRGAACGTCKKVALMCCICHIPVRGSSSFCLACGHGGHSLHIIDWFASHSVCPSGCGCNCLEENPMASGTR